MMMTVSFSSNNGSTTCTLSRRTIEAWHSLRLSKPLISRRRSVEYVLSTFICYYSSMIDELDSRWNSVKNLP